jgi:hypothetical protein
VIRKPCANHPKFVQTIFRKLKYIKNFEAPVHIFYSFEILDFVMFTEGYLFAANRGYISFETYYDIIAFDWFEFIPEPPTGEPEVDFINEDGTLYNRNDAEAWQILAPEIILEGSFDWGVRKAYDPQ